MFYSRFEGMRGEKNPNISHLGGDCSHGGAEAEAVLAPLKAKRKEKERQKIKPKISQMKEIL